MAPLSLIPKKVFQWVSPTDTIQKLFQTPLSDRLAISEKNPEMQAINEVAPFYFKQVEVESDKITFDGGALELEKKDDLIFINVDGEVKKTVEYSEPEFKRLIDFYLGREKTTVETFLDWNVPLLKLLPSIEITFCLYIYKNPDTEGWEFFERCTGKVKFLNLHFKANPDIMKIPIIGESRGVVFYGEQTNETLFESNHLYILNIKHVPSMEQLKDVLKYWQIIKREDGAICFDCPEETYEEYKKEFESWPGSFTRRRLWIPMFKELSVEFHSGKRVVITGDKTEKPGMVRIVMAICPKHPIDSVKDFIERVKGFWKSSTNPAAVKKGAEAVGQL